MTAKYKIFLESPLGERRGTMVLSEEEGTVSGSLELMGFKNPVEGKKCGDEYILRHNLHTAVSSLCCSTVLSEKDGTLRIMAQFGKIKINMHGTAEEE